MRILRRSGRKSNPGCRRNSRWHLVGLLAVGRGLADLGQVDELSKREVKYRDYRRGDGHLKKIGFTGLRPCLGFNLQQKGSTYSRSETRETAPARTAMIQVTSKRILALPVAFLVC